MSPILLYILCTAIWGSTWYAIKFQIDSASPVASVFYRFTFAFIFIFFIAMIRKAPLKQPIKNHRYFFLQGLFLFSLNYVLTYFAEQFTNSGLIAVSSTTLVYFNMLGMFLFFKKPISRNVKIGGLLGGFGILLIFSQDLFNLKEQWLAISGLGINIVATFCSSLGNMVSQKNHQNKIPVLVSTTYGMLYGSIITLVIGIILGQSFYLPTSTSYLLSLGYLSLFGSVITFLSYLTLLGKVGAERAAYMSIITPVIALIISSAFEGLTWHPSMVVGIVFCLIGNVFALRT